MPGMPCTQWLNVEMAGTTRASCVTMCANTLSIRRISQISTHTLITSGSQVSRPVRK